MEYEKKVSVVVPMYFEEKVVEECYKRLSTILSCQKFDYEIIFVNDGSKDATEEMLLQIAKIDTKVKVINFSRNFGHQAAVTAGIFNSTGDSVVIIDADLQDPPSLIPEMVYLWEKGYHIVYAKRKKRIGETKFKLLTAKYFYKFLNYMSDIDIPKDTGDFRLIDRQVVEAFKNMPERNRFIRGMMSWIGFNQTYIEYEREERFAGETKYPIKKMIKFASDGIISFSTKPLRLINKLGFITVIISLLLIIYSFYIKLTGKYAISGWASLMIAITFLGGIQLLSVGILGEYIARIYDESKNRPLYIIKDKRNFDE